MKEFIFLSGNNCYYYYYYYERTLEKIKGNQNLDRQLK